MGYIRLTYNSKALHMDTDVSILFPRRPENHKRNRAPGDPGNPDFSNAQGTNTVSAAQRHEKESSSVEDSSLYDKSLRYQVLYLISGGGGDYTDWPIDTAIRKPGDKSKLVIVMPSILDFTGMQKGADFLTYMGEELPEYIASVLPVSTRREDTFIAGFSYGGYFAYRVALNYPGRFGCVGSFCSPLDVKMDIERLHSQHESSAKADMITGTDRDVLGLASRLSDGKEAVPRMFQTVGTEDFTWDFNISARNHFEKLGLDHTWTQGPGVHSYEYCNLHFQEFLDWLPLKKTAFHLEGGKDNG